MALDRSATFLIADVFNVAGKGIVAVGTVNSGVISLGMLGNVGGIRVKVLKIEMFHSDKLSLIEKGQRCGLLLEGLTKKEDIRKGQLINFE